MEEKSQTGLNHKNARTKEQKNLMAKIEKDGVCPFCVENFTKYHPKQILKEADFWFITENMSPYKGTKHHFLFIYKHSHITKPSEISPEAQLDLFTSINWMIEKYNIKGGSFFMRFGETSYNGSSVEHLHTHLIVGDINEEDHEPVRVKLG